MQGTQPAVAVGCVNRLVGPIKIHVMFTGCVSYLFEDSRPLWFSSDIFSLEEVEHTETVNWLYAIGALVDVRSEWHLRRVKSPGGKAIPAHLAMTRFVVGPSGSVTNPFPLEDIGKLAQDDAAVFDGPNLVQVADSRTQLEQQPFAVGEI